VLISSSGVSTETENGTKNMPSIAEEHSYMLEEELFHTTSNQHSQVLPGIKMSSVSIDNQDSFCTSGTHNSVPCQKEPGQYVDYHTAETDSDSGHGSLQSQAQDTFSKCNELQ